MNTTDRRTRPCSHCGQVLAHEQLIPFQDELLCPACLDEQTTVCSCCGNVSTKPITAERTQSRSARTAMTTTTNAVPIAVL